MKNRFKSIFILLIVLVLLFPGFRILYKYVVTYNKSYSIEIKDDVVTRYVFDPSNKNNFLKDNTLADNLNSSKQENSSKELDEYYDEQMKEYGFDEGFTSNYRLNQSKDVLSNEEAPQALGDDDTKLIGDMSDLKILDSFTDQDVDSIDQEEMKNNVTDSLNEEGRELDLFIDNNYVRFKDGYRRNPDKFYIKDEEKFTPSPKPIVQVQKKNSIKDLKKLKIKVMKKLYYSFEVIRYNIVSKKTININDLIIYVTRNKYVFPNVDGKTNYFAYYKEGTIRGSVVMGYRPSPGVYKIIVKSKSQPKWKGISTSFKMARRIVPPIKRGFGVLTMEHTIPLNRKKVIGIDGTYGDYRNIARWVEYSQSDAFWMLTAQTTGWDVTINSKKPWVTGGFTNLKLLAPEMKKRGVAVGAYAMSYFTPANGKNKISEYTPSLGYDQKNDYIKNSLHISLMNEARFNHLKEFAMKMDKDFNVDYIGFDFIRTGEVDGYEMVEHVVEDMNIRVPAKFKKYSKEQKIRWFARQIKYYTNPSIIAKWRWWRASRVATIMNRVITEGNIRKPVWVFTLGWDHGRQHGQDPYMMFDAGVFIDAVMLYEASEAQFRNMMYQWKSYMKDSRNNMFMGNSSDQRLLDSSRRDMVHEYLYRNQRGYRDLYHNGFTKGFFMHDISRALWSSNRQISILEWMVVYGRSLSDFRSEIGVLPYKAEIIMKNNTTAQFKITNTSKKTISNINIDYIPMFYWSKIEDNIPELITLKKGEAKIYQIKMNPFKKYGNKVILAYKVRRKSYPDAFAFGKLSQGPNIQAYATRKKNSK